MRAATVLICMSPFLAVSVSAMPPDNTLDNPAYSQPADRWEVIEDASPLGEEASTLNLPDDQLRRQLEELRNSACRDTINKARVGLGQPPLLDREPASPDKPLAIYAVDRREGGCSVMAMKGDLDDIRPLPAPMEGPAQVIPAEGDGK